MDAVGNLLLQRNTLGHFSLVRLNLDGSVNWSRPLDAQAFAAVLDDRIYAVEPGVDTEKILHVLENDGTERLRTTFADRDASDAKHLAVGPDGIVYIATSQLNALSSAGELLWQFPTRPGDGYFPYTAPLQLASAANNTLISSSGRGPLGGNLMVSQGIPQDGIDVSLRGDDAAEPGAFKDLQVEVTNYRETMAVELEIVLWDISAGKALSKTVFADMLATNESSAYDCGAMIPSSGNLRLVVNIKNGEGLTLYSREIAVRQ
jgi:hypothetical protein